MHNSDLIIIGGGAGAFAAAIRAYELKAKTVMINAGLPLGGTCVNVGCVPTKRLLRAGEILHLAQNHGIPGVQLKVKKFDFPTLIEDELNLVSQMRQEKYEKVLAGLENVTLLEGYAKFISDTEVRVNGETLSAGKIIIATGSKATVPPIEGIEETGYVTHIEALKLQKLPTELIIIGAGTVLVALCCFTPILVISLAAVGMSAFTPYLDYVLLPALVLMIVLASVSYLRWKKSFNLMGKSPA